MSHPHQGPPPPRPKRKLPPPENGVSSGLSSSSGFSSSVGITTRRLGQDDTQLNLDDTEQPLLNNTRIRRGSIRREGPLPAIPAASNSSPKLPSVTSSAPPTIPSATSSPSLPVSKITSLSKPTPIPPSGAGGKTILSPRSPPPSPPGSFVMENKYDQNKFPQSPAPQLGSAIPPSKPIQRPGKTIQMSSSGTPPRSSPLSTGVLGSAPFLPPGVFTGVMVGGGGLVGGGDGGEEEKEKERNNVAREIFETEKKYVDSLDEMIRCYKNPLLLACEDANNHLKKGDITLMFSNVEVLFNLNKNILDQLKSRLDNWSSTQKMGDVFRQFAPYLKMYTAYGQGYQPALDTYNSMLKENPKFGELLNQYRGGKPLTLEHLLIMPVQRVPRYNLLLSDLLRKTDKNHPDYQNIDLAIKAVEEAATHMNQTMKKSEQMNRLVQNASAEAFGGLLEASRSLLMDGIFTCDIFSDYPHCVSVNKQDIFAGPGGKKTDKYHLFCFNDLLVYIKQSDVKRTKDFSKTTTNIHFNLVWIEEKGEVLIIRCPNRRLIVHFPTAAEKTKWFNEITECIFRSLVPYPSGGTPPRSASNPTPPPLRFGEFTWGDGLDISYNGWWLTATMHKDGTLNCNGNVYKGDFISGLKQGNGKLTYMNGYIYEGEFNKDFPNGEGKLVSPNKEVYRGSFKDGRMHGQGTLEWPNGDRCTGDWEHNRACGRAKLVTHSGIAYEGQVQDSLPHGSGTLTMGHMYYMGVFEYGERQGTGIMDYGNGLKYEGNWDADKYQGKGVLMNTQDQSKYEGEFLSGRKNGMGSMKFGNGDRYEGQWKNDLPHGKGEMIYANKDTFVGTWRSGKYHGTGVLTSNGTKIEGKWVMGQLEGNTKVSADAPLLPGLWNVSKTGIPSITVGDFSVNVDPLVEMPRRLYFNFV